MNTKKKRLPNKKQCAKCPWKVGVDPKDIPNGYDRSRHEKLRETIAVHGAIHVGKLRAMACHESKVGKELYCLGWLFQQLGPGNNLGLRIKMMDYDLSDLQLDGEQHETFEDTLR